MKTKLYCLLVFLFLLSSAIFLGLGRTEDQIVPEKETTEDLDTQEKISSNTSTDIPAFEVGDNWTYHRETEGNSSDSGYIYIEENITYTVSQIETYTYNGTEYYGYNVSVDGEIIEGEIEAYGFNIHSGEIDGYRFQRMSDLGTVVNYEWRKMEGNVTYQGDTYPATIWRETLSHADPVVENHDFPIELGGEFYANTTQRSRNYQRIKIGSFMDEEQTDYQNTTSEKNVSTSPTKKDVSVPAGDFTGFEMNSTPPEDDSYFKYNYAPSAKNYVWSYSYSPSNNISTEEELLSYNVSNRTESLSISPKKGKPGEEVAISGSFPEHPNEDVRIWIPETGDEYSVTADGNGDFSLNIDIPIASDRTPSPGEMGSIGVIAELRSNPKDAYAVSTLVIEEIVLVDITSPAEGALLMDSDVTVEWGSEKADYHEVRLDGDAWEDVGADTSHTFDLADGGHTVEVKATDEDANQTEVKTATDIVNFTVDSTPPEIEITSPEEGAIINSEELTVEWTGDGGEIEVDHYEIRTDDNNWIEVGMDTNYTFAALTDGDHSVEVKAQDKEGRETISGVNFTVNTEAQIDVQDFSVDPPQGTSPLTVDITAQISNEGNSNGTVELSAGDETINTWQLEPGQSESVNESYTLEEIGDHNITLGSEQVTVTVLDGPELVVVDLTLPDTLVEEGDTETIEATVRNDGGMDGTAFIYVADKQIAEEVIPAGDEVNFSAEYTFNEDGEINIDLRDGDNNSLQSDSLYINEAEPSFDVTGLEVEDTGSELEITVGEIENNGSAEGTISLEIIQDGEVIYTVDNWTLEAGDSVQDVQKTYEYDESGDYTVKVGEESEDISVETGAAGSSGDDTPGFTLAILLMSMIFALLAYHRKDQS